MSRALDDLSSEMRPKAVEMLARLVERGIAVIIVDTLRTEAEHQQNLANGTSKAKFSRHLPRRLRREMPQGHPNYEKSDAMDICPLGVYALHGDKKLQWDPADPVWRIIAEVGEAQGLVSGYRWRDPFDPGHVELPRMLWDRL